MRNSKAPSHPASFIESHVSHKDKQTHFSRLIFTVEYIKAQQCDSKKTKQQINKKKTIRNLQSAPLKGPLRFSMESDLATPRRPESHPTVLPSEAE